MSSTPVREAASISITSTWRSSAIERQWSHSPQGCGGRPARAVGADAIERAGDDPRGRRLADAAHPGQDEGMGDAAGGDRVRQGADHRLLADQLGEGLRPVFAGEHAIGGRRVAHCTKPGSASGRPDDDPGRNSLRLLPSGPDRVGEGPVRRRPPAALYQLSPRPGQASPPDVVFCRSDVDFGASSRSSSG